MRAADFIVDIGPKAGVHGGEIVAKGSLDDIMKNIDAFLKYKDDINHK